MSGIIITLSLLACILVISEACGKTSSGGMSGGQTMAPSADDNSYGPGHGPIPPHPFRRRRDESDNTVHPGTSKAMEDIMRALFNELDADEDKSVSVSEWVRRKGNAEDYRLVVATFDKNGDNLLSFDEFLEASKS